MSSSSQCIINHPYLLIHHLNHGVKANATNDNRMIIKMHNQAAFDCKKIWSWTILGKLLTKVVCLHGWIRASNFHHSNRKQFQSDIIVLKRKSSLLWSDWSCSFTLSRLFWLRIFFLSLSCRKLKFLCRLARSIYGYSEGINLFMRVQCRVGVSQSNS
jgi:hypothetical protein